MKIKISIIIFAFTHAAVSMDNKRPYNVPPLTDLTSDYIKKNPNVSKGKLGQLSTELQSKLGYNEKINNAARLGKIKEVQSLLEKGISPNLIWGPQNWTPLHWAATNGNLELARLLLSYKANPNLQTNDGNTSLHHVKINKKKDKEAIIKLLLEHGARTDIANTAGITPDQVVPAKSLFEKK